MSNDHKYTHDLIAAVENAYNNGEGRISEKNIESELDKLGLTICDNKSEYGWVIEAGDPPHYWDGRSLGYQTQDVNDAIRFSRFEDAERARLYLVEGGRHWKSVEHAWLKP